MVGFYRRVAGTGERKFRLDVLEGGWKLEVFDLLFRMEQHSEFRNTVKAGYCVFQGTGMEPSRGWS